MFAQADQLLYKAKAAGRNRVFGEPFDMEKAEAGLHEMATWINKSSKKKRLSHVRQPLFFRATSH